MKRPPMAGTLPPAVAQRPACPSCGTKLRPYITGGDWLPGQTNVPFSERKCEPRRWDGTYHGYDAFCSTRCCVRFANRAFKAGYR